MCFCTGDAQHDILRRVLGVSEFVEFFQRIDSLRPLRCSVLSPRRGFSKGAKETLRPQEAGCSRDTAYIYIIASMSVDALDGLCELTFGSKEIFWDVTIDDKRTSATFYERAPPLNIPARSISDY